MGKIIRYKNIIEKFLSGEKGQRFFNFAYSIGAAIVILGALFKILHLPGGNAMLCIGMGTEVVMFILTAFDRPEKPYKWEEVFPVLATQDPDDRPDFNSGGGIIINGTGSKNAINVTESQARKAAGIPENIELSESDTRSLSESIAKMSAASDQLARMAEMTEATQRYLDQIAGISEQMAQLKENTQSLNEVSSTLLNSYKAITDNSETISQGSTGYVEQMEALNRNIGGLNTIYEIQLKSISSQLDNIDRVNRGLKDIRDMYEKSAAESADYCNETERLAHNMKQLNSVYEKMVKALTVNMYRPMGSFETDDENMSVAEEYRRRTANNNDNA